MTCAEVEELIELYVIGALPAEEGREVAAHLDTCPGCRELEVRTREIAQLLYLGVDQIEPSSELRTRIRALLAEREPIRLVAPAERPRWRALFDWLNPQPVRLAAAFAVVPLVMAGWLGFQVMQLRSEVESTQTALANSWQTSQTAAEIMGKALARGGAMTSVSGTEMAPEASGMLYFSPSDQEGVLVIRGLPELEHGRVYQCWLMNGEQRMNAGTFYRENDGRAMVVIKAPMPLDAVEALGVTEEPHGGSIQPHGDRYMWGRIR